MRLKSTIIMLVAALTGLAYILFFEQRPADSGEQRNMLAKRFRFEAEAVRSIELSGPDERIVCVLEDGEWRIRHPFSAKANASVVNRMLAALRELESAATITRKDRRERGLTVADYGLVPPQMVVRLEGDEFKRLLNIGSTNADDTSLYLAIDNAKEDLFVVGPDFLSALPRHASELRSKQLFDCGPDSVDRLEIKTSEAFISLVRDERSEWNLQQPIVARADRRKVSKLIQALGDLRIASFLPEASPQAPIYGFDEVDSMVMMKGGGDVLGQELRLGHALKDEPDMIYASFRGEDSVFALPQMILDSLRSLDVGDLRERSLLGIASDEVRALKISAGDNQVQLDLDDDGWKMVSPRNWAADVERIDSLLGEIGSAQTVDFVPADAEDHWWHQQATNAVLVALDFGAEPDAAKGGAEEADLEIDLRSGGDRAGAAAAKRSDSKWICLLENNLKDSVSVDPLHYKDHLVMAIDPERVESIRLRSDGGEEILQRDDRNGFSAKSIDRPGKVRVLPQQARLELLGELVCREYIESGEFSPAEYGLDNPERSLTLLLSGDEGISKTLLIGNTRDDGSSYAQIRGKDVVFVLDADAVETLCSDLFMLENNPEP